MMKCRLYIDIEYDPQITDAESLASAFDTLVETALSTSGLLDDYGNPTSEEFYVLWDQRWDDTIPAPAPSERSDE